MTLRVFAHGGGVQSTAALVLSAQGEIEFPVHLFSNVGDDSEHPDTLSYVREVSIPWAQEHGIELSELRRRGPSLREAATNPASPSYFMPMRSHTTGAPMRRACTDKWKIQILNRWVKTRGATAADPAAVGLGISVDEVGRATTAGVRYVRREFPLLDLGLRRSDCYAIIRDAGLPVPPKSSCYFCPYHRPQVWAEMRRDRPDLFERAAQLEDTINANQDRHGRSRVWLTSAGRSIRDAIGPAQADLFSTLDHEIESCDEGVCFV